MERGERLVWVIVCVMIIGIIYIVFNNGMIGFGGTAEPPSSPAPIIAPVNDSHPALVLSVGNASLISNASCHYRPGNLPDPVCSPGEAGNDSLDTICVPGYSSTVRDVSESTKNRIYASYGVTNHTAATYEVDHIIPLCAAGSNSIRNLYPQPAVPVPGFRQKDVLEAKICRMICDGEVDLKIAQQKIAFNWLAYYDELIGGHNVTN
jgi:hypothetical protein